MTDAERDLRITAVTNLLATRYGFTGFDDVRPVELMVIILGEARAIVDLLFPGPKWGDPHFPPGTNAAIIFKHLDTVHANRAPWGNAFIDDFGHENPPPEVGSHDRSRQ